MPDQATCQIGTAIGVPGLEGPQRGRPTATPLRPQTPVGDPAPDPGRLVGAKAAPHRTQWQSKGRAPQRQHQPWKSQPQRVQISIRVKPYSQAEPLLGCPAVARPASSAA